MKKLVWFLVVIVLCGLMCGCSVFDDLQEWKNGDETETGEVSDGSMETSPSNEENKQQLIVDLAEPTEDLTADNSREVVLFFADSDGKQLKKEMRQIVKSEGLAKSTIDELVNGPKDDKLVSVIPDGTSLLSIDIKEGLCTADFSSELLQKGSSTEEQLKVYSIVNTLTQFNSVNQVQLLVNGQVMETLAGNVDISKPLERDNDLIGD